MAIENREEREALTETARGRLVLLRTMADLFAWWAEFRVLSPKILGALINDEHLRIESAKRETARRMKELRDARRAKERNDPTSDENMRRLYPVVGKAPIQWNRERKAQEQDRKDLAEKDRQAKEVQWAEGEGERAKP